MKRKILFLTLALTLLPTFAYAEKVNNEKVKLLTQQEISILIDEVGFIKEDFEAVPVEVARDLIEQKAKKISNGVVKSFTMEKQPQTGIVPMSLEPVDIDLYGNAYVTQGTDLPGFKKILMVASFKWKFNPNWRLTDKMSIGYPATNKFILNASNGQVLGHTNRTYLLQDPSLRSESYTPSDFVLGAGVAATFELYNAPTGGSIIQYVYVPDSESGTSNVLVRYGHKKLTWGAPSIGVYPAGLAVSPSTNVENADYWLTLTW
ncbi:hypothetical protein [Gorillibacterium sp. CAU 1737]|uniref:hypothetical protein n=1 Tax=Gorillibacterium sp. CAU 1737 TaxID=3140362 RepID=UPI003260BD7C